VIFGIGTDIVEMSRMQSTWERFGERFAHRILMDEEIALFRQTKQSVRFLAMRFAGKEAAVKAMVSARLGSAAIRPISHSPAAAASARTPGDG